MVKRDIHELFPMFFFCGWLLLIGLSTEIFAGFPFVAAALCAGGGVFYGWRRVTNNGRNPIIFVGVSLCLIALLLQGIFWLFFHNWS